MPRFLLPLVLLLLVSSAQALDVDQLVQKNIEARGGLAAAAGVGGAGQHAVFGRHPAFALAAQERRHALFDTGGDEHLGVAERDQHRSFGVAGEVRGDRDLAHLVWRAAAGAHLGLLGIWGGDRPDGGGMPAVLVYLPHTPRHSREGGNPDALPLRLQL